MSRILTFSTPPLGTLSGSFIGRANYLFTITLVEAPPLSKDPLSMEHSAIMSTASIVMEEEVRASTLMG